MSRTSNSRPQQKKPVGQGGSTLVGVFVGLVIGVLIAAALAWYFSRPYEFVHRNPVPVAGQSLPPGAQPITLGGKPGDKPVAPPPGEPKPAPAAAASTAAPAGASAPADAANKDDKKFDFYDLLPKGDQATLPAPKADASAAVGVDKFYLQLGAFADPSEVDNLKARLALMGIEASVQKLESPDKGTLHRVRVGPYLKPEDMNAVRTQLAQAGVESTVVKVKPSAPAATPAAH